MPTAIKLNSRLLRISTAGISLSLKAVEVNPSVIVRTIFGTPFRFGRMPFSKVSMSLAKVSASGVFVVPFKVENGFQKGNNSQWM